MLDLFAELKHKHLAGTVEVVHMLAGNHWRRIIGAAHATTAGSTFDPNLISTFARRCVNDADYAVAD